MKHKGKSKTSFEKILIKIKTIHKTDLNFIFKTVYRSANDFGYLLQQIFCSLTVRKHKETPANKKADGHVIAVPFE